MKKGKKILAAGLVTLALCSPAVAWQSLEELKGQKVRNQHGTEIGIIQEILISQEGYIEAVIVKEGGFFGIGGEDRKIEWDRLSQSNNSDYLTYSEEYSGSKDQGAAKEDREIPASQQDQATLNLSDERQITDKSNERFTQPEGVIEAGLAASLIGHEIVSKNGESLGTLEQFVFSDMQSTSVKYVLIQGQQQDTYHPLPVKLVRVRKDGNKTHLEAQIDKQTFAESPTIKRGEIMQLSRQQEAQKIESYYGISPAWQKDSQGESVDQ